MLPIWFLQFATITSNLSATINYEIDGNNIINEHLPHFWSSTGFSPPDPHEKISKYLSSNDMLQNIAYISSLPMFDNNRRRQVRVHWLLDLIQLKQMKQFNDNYIEYNFKELDDFIDLLMKFELIPGFIFEGNPSKYFKNFNKNQEKELIIFWDLIKSLVSRYVDKYGSSNVRSWNFECWNDPSIKDFDGINNVSIKNFNNYFAATYQALLNIDSNLKLIGPSDRCLPIPRDGSSSIIQNILAPKQNESYCWSLIDKMVKIIANDDQRLNLAFNFKTKAGRKRDANFRDANTAEDEDSVDITSIIDKEKILIKELLKRYENVKTVPKSSKLEVQNNGANIDINWWSPKEWKSDATYAGLYIKNVIQHIETYFIQTPSQRRRGDAKNNFYEKINFTLLSEDNSQLSYHPYEFTQSTLLSRLQINGTAKETLTEKDSPNLRGTPTPKDESFVTLIKKPIYSSSALLSLLGNKIIDSKVISVPDSQGTISTENNENIKIISTIAEDVETDEKIYSILFVNSLNKPTSRQDGGSVLINTTIKLSFDDLSADWKLVRYTIDNLKTNPYKVYKENVLTKDGATRQITPEVLQKIILATEPIIDQAPKEVNINFNAKDGRPETEVISFELPLPSVSLVLLCSMSDRPPEKLTNLKFIRINDWQVLITWKHSKSRCVKIYEIEFSPKDTNNWVKINENEVLFPNYNFINRHHVASDGSIGVRGRYRVRQVDMFNRKSKYSDIFNYD